MRLAITARSKYRIKQPAPIPVQDYFDIILTLDGDPITTLDNRWLAKQ